MASRAKIFLLEDDMNLNETVCEFLQDEGFEVESSYDGEDAQDKIYENHYDLFLFDVNVPGMNGFELLKTLRQNGDKTPAIYLTSLNSVDDLSIGFESGCDDYIRKPFALKELLLRVESLLKREFHHVNSEEIQISENLSYNSATNELVKEGISLQLQNKEAKLLKLLLQRRGEVVSHELIFDTLWGYDEVASDDALRTYIKNLRKIVGKERIISVKKLGYRFIKE